MHGLNEEWLRLNGMKYAKSLKALFKVWLKHTNYIALYANNPLTECQQFTLKIHDLSLPPWVERANKPYHIMAQKFKELNIPICGISCDPIAHSKYIRPPLCRNRARYLAKFSHHHHCSLYDCYELYLCFLHSL